MDLHIKVYLFLRGINHATTKPTHISAITASTRADVHFYTKIISVRVVNKTMNQNEGFMCRLFYGDEQGSPGTELTFFEIFPVGCVPMKIQIALRQLLFLFRVMKLLDFWQKRLGEYEIFIELAIDVTLDF